MKGLPYPPNRIIRSIQSGFTLIELMISLVLGLLIIAAVIQVYIVSTRTLTIQRGGSDIQDSSVFGIESLEEQIRLANLGDSTSTNITDATAGGGIVLTAANTGKTNYTDLAALTSSTGDTVGSGGQWTGLSDMNVGSDQLTLQYKNITGNTNMVDCESNTIGANEQVIERFFIRNSTTAGVGKVLACDAGRISTNASGAVSINDFGTTRDSGSEFILNVNQFKVLLGTQTTNGQMVYYTPNAYKTLSGTKPAIVAIKIALIARGSKPVTGATPPTSFTVFGNTQTLNTAAQTPAYLRKVYESTTMLRNARVINITVDNAALISNP